MLFMPMISPGQTDPATVVTTAAETAVDTDTLATLVSFVKLRNELLQDIKVLNKQIDSEPSEAEKTKMKQELEKLESDLRTTTRNLENIAAGVDISRLRAEKQEEFNFQKEIFALLKPALDEMKDMTSHVRQKSDLREKIAYYEERLPVIEQALSNISRLQEQSQDKSLQKSLKGTTGIWRKQQAFMQSQLQAARLELDKLEAAETSITEASHSYLKSFFQKRGLYLTEALLLVLAILVLSRLSDAAMERYISGFRKKHRSFRVRLVELAHRILTVIMVIFGPMIVFYLVEDWVLFSLGILLLLGMALTLRQALPLYWHQVQLFLNIGSVREGERVLMEGLPWLVERINIYCTFSNPMADISQRLPIADLIDLKSRPAKRDEPWFPCKKGDWVILSDGVRGKVIGISHELVQLVERGGAQLTYQTSDFLAKSPRNLVTNFRIKETLGISYSLQKESTTSILETLHRYIQQRAEQEGYGEQLLNLRVEFAQAGNSSLDLAVIADFKGELGDLYNRLRRAIQRWGVDACTEYGWEIPFPQMTLHGAVARAELPGA
ncbi:MAG: hypothetical protein WBN48_06785 [Thiogranum sp.]